MDPIEIIIRVIVSKEGDITVLRQEAKETPLSEVPYRGNIENSIKMTFACERWVKKVGRKEAGTCRGCTIQCHMKGRYLGKPIDIKPGDKA